MKKKPKHFEINCREGCFQTFTYYNGKYELKVKKGCKTLRHKLI